MKIYRSIAAFGAVLMMCMAAACGEEPEVVQPPDIYLPQTSATQQPLSSEQSTTTQQTASSAAASEAMTAQTTSVTTQSASVIPEVTSEPTEITEESQEVTVELVPEEPSDPMDYGAYLLSKEQMEFTERSIFVGDSICKGFGTYNVLSFAHVYANGSMGTRNFNEYTFTYGRKNEEIGFTELLHRTKPELVFLSMGMNDINMIHPSDYRSNYARIVDTALSESEAVVYLCAMTPVRSNFTSNERIDYFNNELRELAASYPERVYYVDYGRHMLNDKGLLNDQLDGGDGVHLAPYAYRIALWEIYHTLLQDGTMYPREMTSAPTLEVSAESVDTLTEESDTFDSITDDTSVEATDDAAAETAEAQMGGIRID